MQLTVGFDEGFLSDVLGIMEIVKLGVGQGINAFSVFIHKEAEHGGIAVEALLNDLTVFCLHFLLLSVIPFTY